MSACQGTLSVNYATRPRGKLNAVQGLTLETQRISIAQRGSSGRQTYLPSAVTISTKPSARILFQAAIHSAAEMHTRKVSATIITQGAQCANK
jgi:hypothetical protein